MASLSEMLGFSPAQASAPQDEVLEMVQRARKAEAGVQEGTGLGNFLKRAPDALLGLGPPMPYSQTMPLKVAGGDDDVVKLQAEMKAKGYYGGKIDGKMGPETVAAKRAYDAAEQQRSAADLEKLRVQTEAAKIAEQKRAGEQKVVDRETGDAKLKQAEENMPWYGRVMRDYAQPVGMAAGGLAAFLLRRGMVNKYNSGRAETAKSADDLMRGAPPAGAPVTAGNVQDRAGRVNEFWTSGQRGAAQQPFLSDPAAARGFRSNANAPQSADLYRPNVPMNIAKDAAIPTVGAIDYGASNWMKRGAQEKEAAANKAYDANPSDANLQALQKAKENVALYEGGERSGQAMMLIGGGKALFGGRVEKRPGTATADAERAAIDAYLTKGARGVPGGPAGQPKLSTTLKQLQLLPAPAPQAAAPKPAVKGGSHPDHDWNAKAGRWQDADGKFLPGPPPKD